LRDLNETGAHCGARQMAEKEDRPNVVIPPPVAWALAIIAGLGAGWLYPLPFVSTSIPRAWVGGGVHILERRPSANNTLLKRPRPTWPPGRLHGCLI